MCPCAYGIFRGISFKVKVPASTALGSLLAGMKRRENMNANTNAAGNAAGKSSIKKMVEIGMLGAVSVILMMFEIPLWFAPSFYKIDLS